MSKASPTSCRVIQAKGTFRGKQGFVYDSAISAESVGASGLCMHLLEIPPSARAKAHLHRKHESSIYVLRGKAGMWYGAKLEQHLVAKAGDFVYIPAGMPHLPYNLSARSPVSAVLARTDPNEQESVVLLPALEKNVSRAAPSLGVRK